MSFSNRSRPSKPNDYAAGRLDARDRAAFENRIAGNARLERRLAFARALARTSTASFPWTWIGLAAALVIAVAGAIWFGQAAPSVPQQVAVQPPVITPSIPSVIPGATSTPAPEPSGRAGTINTPAVLATIAFFGPSVRDAGEAKILAIPSGSGVVRIEVAIDDGDVYPSYRIDLLSASGTLILNREGQPASTASTGRIVRLSAPERALPAGGYRVETYGVSNGQTTRLSTYTFRVTR